MSWVISNKLTGAVPFPIATFFVVYVIPVASVQLEEPVIVGLFVKSVYEPENNVGKFVN